MGLSRTDFSLFVFSFGYLLRAVSLQIATRTIQKRTGWSLRY